MRHELAKEGPKISALEAPGMPWRDVVARCASHFVVVDQAADVRPGRVRTSQSAPPTLGDLNRRLTCTECAEYPI